MPDISLACEEAERKGIQIGERKDRDASDLIIAIIAGRMRMVRDRLYATRDPVLVELAQELDDVLPVGYHAGIPVEHTPTADCRCADCVAYDESSPL